MSDLSGLVSLITGAGSGIGRAAALRMAECGSAIMCADIDHAAAQDTAAQVAEHGGRSAAIQLDVSDEAAVKAALRKTVDELGGLNVIVNNAGIGGALLGWDRTILVNLSGVYYGLSWGVTGDLPVVGDYDGDGKADASIFRPSTKVWYLLRSTAGFTQTTWGNGTNPRPIPTAFIP